MENQSQNSSAHRITTTINGDALAAFVQLRAQNPKRSESSLCAEILERALIPTASPGGTGQISTPPSLDRSLDEKSLTTLKETLATAIQTQTVRLAFELEDLRCIITEIRSTHSTGEALAREVEAHIARQDPESRPPSTATPARTSRLVKVALPCLLLSVLSAQLWLVGASSQNTRTISGNQDALALRAHAIEARLTEYKKADDEHALILEKAMSRMAALMSDKNKKQGQPDGLINPTSSRP